MAKRRWKWWDTSVRDKTAYQHVQNMVPNMIGNYETARAPDEWGSGNTVTGTVIAADAFQKTDGTARLFALTATKIYEVTSSGVTDRSAGGGSYTSTTMWQGAQYGDVTIYTSRTDDVQASSSGAFADLTGTPPKAKYICTQSLAVCLAAYNDGVNTYEDGLWFSDIGDHTTWTPSSSNLAANFRLLQTPGAITAVCAFKGDVLAFKDNSFYRISFVDLPYIWRANLISDNIGADGPGCVCVCGDAVVFGSVNGWYVYDGATVQKIAPGRDVRHGTQIVATGSAGGPFNVNGPNAATYAAGATFFQGNKGLAYFCVSNGSSNSASILAIQMTPGEGFGAFGQFIPILDGASSSTIRALVRGTSPALVAAGIGLDATYNTAVPGIFLASSTNSAPYSIEDRRVSPSNTVTGLLQTSFFGTPEDMTYFRTATPVRCYYGGVANSGILKGVSSAKMTLEAVNMSSPDVTAAPPSGDGIERFGVNKTARFLAFIVENLFSYEIEDILIDSSTAGDD